MMNDLDQIIATIMEYHKALTVAGEAAHPGGGYAVYDEHGKMLPTLDQVAAQLKAIAP